MVKECINEITNKPHCSSFLHVTSYWSRNKKNFAHISKTYKKKQVASHYHKVLKCQPHLLKPNLMRWAGLSSASTKRARRSDAATFNQNKRIFFLLVPKAWFKVEEFRLEKPPYLLYLFITCRLRGVANSYTISMYIIFLLAVNISYHFLSSLWWLEFSSLEVKYYIFR